MLPVPHRWRGFSGARANPDTSYLWNESLDRGRTLAAAKLELEARVDRARTAATPSLRKKHAANPSSTMWSYLMLRLTQLGVAGSSARPLVLEDDTNNTFRQMAGCNSSPEMPCPAMDSIRFLIFRALSGPLDCNTSKKKTPYVLPRLRATPPPCALSTPPPEDAWANATTPVPLQGPSALTLGPSSPP